MKVRLDLYRQRLEMLLYLCLRRWRHVGLKLRFHRGLEVRNGVRL